MPTSTAGYWDRYAAKAKESETDEEALKDAFGWTQYPGHGPGDELLGSPQAALELGFGAGHAVAALAVKGVDAVGIDISPMRCEQARARWGHLPGAEYEQADVLDFLERRDRQWNAIYSIWGALWFTDPVKLLPLVLQRLTPGGRLVFSHAPPVPGSYGMQGMYGEGFTRRPVWIYRWAYEPEGWARLLREHGYDHVEARTCAAPDPACLGTLVVVARRPCE